MFAKLQQFAWESAHTESPFKQQLSLFIRIMTLVIRDLMNGMLQLRSMSLVYTTLLSLVPLLAVSFSVLKGFGVHNQLEPMLLSVLEPLGDKGPEITAQILGFVENMKMGVLGSVGMIMLLYTVISLIYKIETAFNFTWRIQSSRTPAQRFSSYLSIVMVGPVLMFSAIGISATLANHSVVETLNQYETIGTLIKFIGYLIPLMMIIGVFTLIFMLIPNIKVKFTSALYGAFISGVIWVILGRVFASFASGSSNFTAIYSGFAIMILFMIWLYLGWLVLLTGVNITYYHQHTERLTWDKERFQLTPKIREAAMLQIMLEIAQHHENPILPAVTVHSLALRLNMPTNTINKMLTELRDNHLIKASDDTPAQFMPAKSLSLISVNDVLQVALQTKMVTANSLFETSPKIHELLNHYDSILDEQFSNTSLKTIVNS